MIQQPRVPPTGQRQAIEVHIKWREVLDYKRDLLRMLSIGTGWPVAKLDQVRKAPGRAGSGAWGTGTCSGNSTVLRIGGGGRVAVHGWPAQAGQA